jgi:hypothetical protein
MRLAGPAIGGVLLLAVSPSTEMHILAVVVATAAVVRGSVVCVSLRTS